MLIRMSSFMLLSSSSMSTGSPQSPTMAIMRDNFDKKVNLTDWPDRQSGPIILPSPHLLHIVRILLLCPGLIYLVLFTCTMLKNKIHRSHFKYGCIWSDRLIFDAWYGWGGKIMGARQGFSSSQGWKGSQVAVYALLYQTSVRNIDTYSAMGCWPGPGSEFTRVSCQPYIQSQFFVIRHGGVQINGTSLTPSQLTQRGQKYYLFVSCLCTQLCNICVFALARCLERLK